MTMFATALCGLIVGVHSDQIVERLGYTYGPAVIHRNDMVLLTDD